MSLTRSVKILARSIIAPSFEFADMTVLVKLVISVTGINIKFMSELILNDLDINNANITLQICTYLV